MRDDIAKVIVERPRRGGNGELSKQYRREVVWSRLREEGREEDSPLREHLRRKWGWDRKQFSDFLAPVRGFLRKSVGRPWDDVWSEISSHLSSGSTTQRHVLGHVLDDVEVNAVEQPDGTITDPRGRKLYSYRSHSFYVCPNTGVLCKVPHDRRTRWTTSLEVPVVRFHRIDGVWFEVDFARPPVIGRRWVVGDKSFSSVEKLNEWLGENYGFYSLLVKETSHYALVHDVVAGRTAELQRAYIRPNRHWLDSGDLYCASKRQAGKKLIRDFGLRDLVEDHGGPPAVVRPAM